MKKFLFGYLLLAYPLILFGQNAGLNKLSPYSVISLVVCEPDSSNILTAFGHCALRVYDPAFGINSVYDYGTLEIQSGWNSFSFLSNSQLAKRSIQPFNSFKLKYTFFGRHITEQKLNLTFDQRQLIFSRLIRDFQIEKTEYNYHYLRRNCATEVRDVVFLNIDLKSIVKTPHENLTYRRIIRPYLRDYLTSLLVDISLGLPADRQLTKYDATFLPYSLNELFEEISLTQKIKLITKTRNYTSDFPLILFSLLGLAITVISIRDYYNRQLTNLIDNIIFLLTGFCGFTLLTLWLVYGNTEMGWNLNLIWLSPTNLLAHWLPGRYFKILGALHLCLAVIWYWLPQDIPSVILPLISGFGIRYCVISYIQDKRNLISSMH